MPLKTVLLNYFSAQTLLFLARFDILQPLTLLLQNEFFFKKSSSEYSSSSESSEPSLSLLYKPRQLPHT